MAASEPEQRHTLTFTVTAPEDYIKAVLPGLKNIARACHSITTVDCDLVITPEQTNRD